MFQITSKAEIFYQGIYQSFSLDTESYIYRNYLINHDKGTIQPRNQDFDMELYNFIHRGQDLAGCGYNFNNRAQFQCQDMGFQLTETDKKDSAEIFIFYILPHRKNPYVIANSGTRLLNKIMEFRNISRVYATVRCDLHLIYTRFCWKIVDSLDCTTGKNIYLIRYSR